MTSSDPKSKTAMEVDEDDDEEYEYEEIEVEEEVEVGVEDDEEEEVEYEEVEVEEEEEEEVEEVEEEEVEEVEEEVEYEEVEEEVEVDEEGEEIEYEEVEEEEEGGEEVDDDGGDGVKEIGDKIVTEAKGDDVIGNDMATKTMYGNMMNEKLDGTNYDIWHRKMLYLLDECGTEDTITIVLAEPKDKSAATYQQDLDAFREWTKKDRCARYSMLNCMHNDLIGEFESCLTAKDMWDKLKVTFGQTSATRLRALNLKWMQYTMDPKHGVAEHLRVMSAMIRDLKAAGREISDEEQVLNVIRSLPNEPEQWKNFKLLMAHSEHVKSFTEISRHLEMEEERQKALGISNAAFVAEANTSKKNNQNQGKGEKGRHHSQNHGPKSKQFKTKGRKEKNKARQLCYNCKKKGHYLQECPELDKTQEQATHSSRPR